MKSNTIILAGLGDLNDEDSFDNLDEMKALAKKLRCELRPTYHDWQIEGKREDVLTFTAMMWGIGEEEWIDSGFQIIKEEGDE